MERWSSILNNSNSMRAFVSAHRVTGGARSFSSRFIIAGLAVSCFLVTGQAPAAPDAGAIRLAKAVELCRPFLSGKDLNMLQVSSFENAVCLSGRLSLGDEEIVAPLLSTGKILVVKSIGGSGIAATRIGLIMLQKSLDVAVYDICYSACANYLFLAGRLKFVDDGALLAWHGAPSETRTVRERQLDTSGLVALTQELSRTFYSQVGVDPVVARRPSSLNPNFSSWRTSLSSDIAYGWTWMRASLERFGVRSIVYYNHPNEAAEQARLSAKFRMKILFDVDGGT